MRDIVKIVSAFLRQYGINYDPMAFYQFVELARFMNQFSYEEIFEIYTQKCEDDDQIRIVWNGKDNPNSIYEIGICYYISEINGNQDVFATPNCEPGIRIAA